MVIETYLAGQGGDHSDIPLANSKLSDLIEKQNKIDYININKINEIATTKLLESQEKISNQEKNVQVLLEPCNYKTLKHIF